MGACDGARMELISCDRTQCSDRTIATGLVEDSWNMKGNFVDADTIYKGKKTHKKFANLV